MQIHTVQQSTTPNFKAKLKINDFNKILSGGGEYSEKAKTVHFFSGKELSEVKKIFAEKTKDIKGTLSLTTHGDSYFSGWDYSGIKLERASRANIYDSIPVSILNCAPPNTKVRAGSYMYKVADKPTFNNAHKIREEYDEVQALMEYERNRPKLSEDHELKQKFDDLVKMQLANPDNKELSLEIYKVSSKIAEEEIKLEEELNPIPIGRKPKTVKTLVNGLVKMLKIMDTRDKKMQDLLQLRKQVVELQAKMEKEGSSRQVEEKIAKLEQEIDKIKFKLTVSDNIAVGKIFGTEVSIRDYIPKVQFLKEIGAYCREWGDHTYEEIKKFQSKNK